MKFLDDFKKFIFRGNVVDMAVGVVIGGSFGKIVTGLVNYIINPFVGIFVKGGNLDSLKTVIHPAVAEVVDEAGAVVRTLACGCGTERALLRVSSLFHPADQIAVSRSSGTGGRNHYRICQTAF